MVPTVIDRRYSGRQASMSVNASMSSNGNIRAENLPPLFSLHFALCVLRPGDETEFVVLLQMRMSR
jgi:hypothetical protein